MLISRHLLSSVSKAVKNNQKFVILRKNQISNFRILDIICNHGFIQGYEVRGNYVIIMLKQLYKSSNNITPNKAFESIKLIKRKKNCSSISASKWKQIINISGHAACYVISTDFGIIDSKSKIHSGGIPLLKVL